MTELVTVDQRGGAVWLRINRPDRLNALNAEAVQGLRDGLEGAVDSHAVAVVVTGVGRAFCTGADLVVAEAADGKMDEPGRRFLRDLNSLYEAVEASPVPVIAAVNGACIAAGIELLLVCDLAVAVRTARIGDGHARFGIVPGGGGSVRLPLMVGMRAAKRLLLLGELILADEAREIGLVNWVVDDGDLESTVDDIVRQLEGKGPNMLARTKYLANMAWKAPVDIAVAMEHSVVEAHLLGDEVGEGLRAFVEKRPPRFRG